MPKGYKRPNGPTLIRLTAKQITELTYVAHEYAVTLRFKSRHMRDITTPERLAKAHVLLNLRRTLRCLEYLNPTRKTCADCGVVKAWDQFYAHNEPPYGLRLSIRCKTCDKSKYHTRDAKRELKLATKSDRTEASEATE